MTGSRLPGRTFGGSNRAQSRGLPLLALCVFGLVVAALALPPVSDRSPGGGGESGGALDDLPRIDVGSGNLTLDPEDLPFELGNVSGARIPTEGCAVVLGRDPVPGARLAVYVLRDAEPVAGTRVWFNDRLVGRTDSQGRVVGRVPYERDLRVRVGLPGECAFVTPSGRRVGRSADVGGVGANAGLSAVLGPRGGSVEPAVASVSWEPAQAEGNASATVPVDGEVEVGVRGDPYPGETVVVAAAIRGVPFRNATVSVDGERVGRTDSRGRYRLRVPDEERVTVRVSRGEFAGTATVDVWTLTVSVQPRGLLAVPGGTATLRATFGPRPAPNAAVFVDGERVGRTGPRGRLRIRLPSDPGATIEVRARGQTTTLPLWAVYGPSVALVAGLLGLAVGSVVTAGRRYGRRAGALVLLGWLGLVALVSGYLLAGWYGLAAATALVGSVWLAVVLRYRGETLVDAGSDAGGLLGRLGRWLARLALSVTDRLSNLTDRLVGVPARLRDWLRSAAGAVRRALAAPAAWFAALPGRLSAIAANLARAAAAVARGALTAPRRLVGRYGRWRVLAAGILLVGGIVGGYAAAGLDGVFAALGAAIVAGVGLALLRASGEEPEPETGDEGSTAAGGSATAGDEGGTADSGPESLRAFWRWLARRVVPDGWRSRTPAEVARTATDRGLPAEPVETLADVFREVEYGGRPMDESRRQRARAAFDRIRDAWESGEGEE